MTKLATTKLSSKGQVVIPEEIRERMRLHSGDQFLVFAENDVLILKIIAQPNAHEFSNLIKKARKSAKISGLTKAAAKSAVKNARKK